MRLFAQLDWQPMFEDHGLPLAIMGLTVVFAALTLLRVFIGLLPKTLAILDRYLPEQEGASHAAVHTDNLAKDFPEEVPVELPEEILAVIAAAVAATVYQPHRILHARELTSEDLRWTLEGRLQHHASHRIQPRDPRRP